MSIPTAPPARVEAAPWLGGTLTIRGVGGTAVVRPGMIDRLTIGTLAVQRVSIRTVDMAAGSIGGVVGQETLRLFENDLDMPRRTATF